ncbi:MAG TPA: TonB family protein [Pyrinomonadaceae bacterium]|nr:TonB family protein [Pyrinomonadaceae bacterium]
MKIIFTLLAILFIGLSTHAQQGRQLVHGQAAASVKRIALVIGNGKYENAPHLKNPTNDATDIAESLGKAGFTVDHGINLTQRQMKAMIRAFGEKLKAGGQGLFYFAGHGVQLRGRNYLIPVDANIQSEADVEDQGVDTNLMLGIMDEAGNGLNVVILDACRNNPFGRSFRSASNGLAQMDAPSGTLIAYATAPGSIASDGNARNGLYTQELLKNMLVPGLSIEEVFKRVRIAVRNSTGGQQTPWEASSLTGDFYFTPLTSKTIPPIASDPIVVPRPSSEPQPEKSEPSRVESGGVLNGKAISLPEPAYPAAAKAIRASGTVSVEVTIDEQGRVISARAISGHVLLHAAAVKAANEARFPPSLIRGQPVKVTGVINYTFTLP